MNFIDRGGGLHARIFVRSVDFLDISKLAMPGCRVEVTGGFEYQPCDIAVVYGLENPPRTSLQGRLRNAVYRMHRGPIITIESSIMGRVFKPRRSWFFRPRRPKQQHPYFRVAVGGALGDTADFNATNSPPDRWLRMSSELDLNLLPYRCSGSHILVIGQVPNDASLRGLDLRDWLLTTAVYIRERTNRPIVVRLHPSTRWRFSKLMQTVFAEFDDISISTNERLQDDLRNAWTCVTYSSGAAIDALMAGIPPICASPASLAYSICSRSLDDFENPLTPEREQFFFDLAYSQWSLEEMMSGTVWHHLLPAISRRIFAPREVAPVSIMAVVASC